MRKSFVVLTIALAAVGLTGSLAGCVVAPAQPAYGYGYGYDSGYYAPGYYPAYPAYAEPSIGIGFGFGGGDRGGWHHHHGWGGHGGHGGHEH